MLDHQTTAAKYYAEWLDCDISDFDGGVVYVCSPKRDVALQGHAFPVPLSIFNTGSAVVVSYSSELEERIGRMKRSLFTVDRVGSHFVEYLRNLFPGEKIDSSIKFAFERQISHSSERVVPLCKDDFALFLNFRLSLGQNEWVGMRQYFESISEKGYCMARMADGKAVSMTDAPSMAFIPDMVQEIGINTLPEYRRKGYAKEVVSACMSKILSDNKCPMWSCDADNQASERLAYSVGFGKFSDEYHVDVR